MNNLQMLLGTVAFFLSLWGLKISGMPRQLRWFVAAEIQMILLFVFAMAGQLQLGYWALLFLGLAGGSVRIYLTLSKKWRPKFEDERFHLSDFWMFFFGLLFVCQLLQSPLVHYDNYSHWAVMVKYLHYQGYLPLAKDHLILFTSYLPGTSLFIANFVRWTGISAGTMLVGQFILIWSALFACFSVLVDQRRRLNQAIIFLGIALTMVVNISIRTNNLLVDYVLAVMTAAGLAGIWSLRRSQRWQLLYFALTAACLMLVKNSGSFFALILFVYLLWLDKGWQKKLLGLLSFLVSFLPFAIWQLHVKQTFAATTNHAINVQSYQKQLGGESAAQLQALAWRVVHHLCDLNTGSTQAWICLNLYGLALFAVVCRYLKHKEPILPALMGCNSIMALFYLALYWIYALTMTPSEAKSLNGFERYMSTVVNISILIMAMVTAVVVDRCYYEQNVEKRNLRSYSSVFAKNVYQISTLVAIVFSVIGMLSEINGLAYNARLGRTSMPVKLQKIAPEETAYNHAKILLVDAEPADVNDDYDYYVGRYYFFSDQVKAREAFLMTNKAFKKCLEQYEYVALPDEHQTFQAMIQHVYHQKVKPGLYRVEADRLVKVAKLGN